MVQAVVAGALQLVKAVVAAPRPSRLQWFLLVEALAETLAEALASCLYLAETLAEALAQASAPPARPLRLCLHLLPRHLRHLASASAAFTCRGGAARTSAALPPRRLAS